MATADQLAVPQLDQAQHLPLSRGDRGRPRHVGLHGLLQALAQQGGLPGIDAIQQRPGRRQPIHHTQEGITRDQRPMGGLELSRLSRPRPLELQEGEPTSAADHREGGGSRSKQEAPLAHGALLAGADEVAQFGAELVAPLRQPGPAPGELQAAEECSGLVGRRGR